MNGSSKNVWIRIAFHMGAKVREDGRIHIYRISDGTLAFAESPVAVLRKSGCTDVRVHCTEVHTGTLLNTIIDISGVHENWPDTIPDNNYLDYCEFYKENGYDYLNWGRYILQDDLLSVVDTVKDSSSRVWWLRAPSTEVEHEE